VESGIFLGLPLSPLHETAILVVLALFIASLHNSPSLSGGQRVLFYIILFPPRPPEEGCNPLQQSELSSSGNPFDLYTQHFCTLPSRTCYPIVLLPWIWSNSYSHSLTPPSLDIFLSSLSSHNYQPLYVSRPPHRFPSSPFPVSTSHRFDWVLVISLSPPHSLSVHQRPGHVINQMFSLPLTPFSPEFYPVCLSLFSHLCTFSITPPHN